MGMDAKHACALHMVLHAMVSACRELDHGLDQSQPGLDQSRLVCPKSREWGAEGLQILR
jgi:hypothetical protein